MRQGRHDMSALIELRPAALQVVEVTEFCASEKLTPFFQSEPNRRAIRIARTANEHELTLPSYSNASCTFAHP
jgi:hypothetical protein